MEIRRAQKTDLRQLLELYTELHGNAMPAIDDALEQLWRGILEDRNHHIIIGLLGGRIISSCVIVIVPNLTHGQRPYALIENVITRESHRGNGYAGLLLDHARSIAETENCYKIMLLTGSKLESTLRFYEKAGYNRDDKTAFIRWLEQQPPSAERDAK